MSSPISKAPDDLIRAQAYDLGFEAVGVTSPDGVEDAAVKLDRFLELGRHGTMEWMATRAHHRRDPHALWPQVQSIVMVGMNYGPPADPLTLLDHKGRASISVYARNKDYHDVLKARLKQLGRWMVDTYDCQIKVFVDTAPVMEKPLAQTAGLGWQGKHTNLVSRSHGSWLFLGAIYTNLPLSPDRREADHCGRCRACLDICPTRAFPAPYELDARRCLSYLTIEHKGSWPEEFRIAMGNRIYGCDDCLAVCPWNKFAVTASESRFHARAELQAPCLADLVQLDDTAFRRVFSGSPIKRIGRNRFVRNVLYAIGNSSDRSLMPYAEALMTDADPVVCDAACWAVEQLRQCPD